MADSQKAGGSILVGMIVFVVLSAWVAGEVFSTSPYMSSSYVPAYPVAKPPSTAATAIPVRESLAPDETLVVPAESGTDLVSEPPATRRAPAPRAATAPPKAQPRRPAIHRTASRATGPRPLVQRTAIVVEERRLTRDERIELDVMERLAANQRISGKIAVEANDAVVRLSGWTRTVGQAREAERDARSVRSVRQVRNEIRPRVGGSV